MRISDWSSDVCSSDLRSVCSPRQAPLCHSMTSSRRNFPQHMFASPKRPLPDMVKTSDELALLRVSGKLLASVFEMLAEPDLAGMSTLQVNDLVDRFITRSKTRSVGKECVRTSKSRW